MAENSNIEWTDHTFNPWIGCTKVGPGCDNCYAEALQDARLGRVRWGAGNPRDRTSASNWALPGRWQRQAENEFRTFRVFCASLADVFDNEVPDEWRADLFSLIRNTPRLHWQLLTKRIGNVRGMLPHDWGDGYPNVWLGATVVTQDEADRDVPKLLQIPARIRFLSCEPLLEAVDLYNPYRWTRELDWVICGGESGPHARPMAEMWARGIASACRRGGCAFFMKQGSQANWPHWKEFERWTSPLQVRQFPVLDKARA